VLGLNLDEEKEIWALGSKTVAQKGELSENEAWKLGLA
jgi:hypothetical protein